MLELDGEPRERDALDDVQHAKHLAQMAGDGRSGRSLTGSCIDQ
jgi:hypothetical protein